MNQSRMPSPAILVAVLALVAALAGTAVAGPDASTSASVKKKQFKKLKKRVKALEQQGQQPGTEGPSGEQGEPGQNATKLFGYIRDGAETANVQFGRGVSAVSDPAGNNSYVVTFNRSVVNCVFQAMAGVGNPTQGGGVLPSSAVVTADIPGRPDQVGATFTNPAGNLTDTSFMITAFC
jgi:hypothetical protein